MNIGMKLSVYIRESKKAQKALSDKFNHNIPDIDFQNALVSVLGLNENDSTSLLEYELTAEEMLEKLKNYEFPKEIGSIEFIDSILPDDMPRRLDEQMVKNKGEIWVIHKYDRDTLPSNPHAHNKETGYKLHLGNGELYTYNNNALDRKISRKHLLEIRDKVKNITLPPLVI